jgi:hypothetical protein
MPLICGKKGKVEMSDLYSLKNIDKSIDESIDIASIVSTSWPH